MALSLADFVQATPADAPFIAACEREADALVSRRVGTATVPAPVRDRAVLEVGADLFYRRNTRNGVAGFEGIEPQPVRIARDPMRAAADLLRPYLGPAIA